jgi:NADH-quinone oxidoreductase subunit N
MNAVAPISAEITLVGASLLLLILARFVRRGRFSGLVAGLAALVAGILAYELHRAGGSEGAFGGMYALDAYAVFFKVLFCLNLVITVLLSRKAMTPERSPFAEYYALLLLATSGMMLVASATDLIVLYLGLELMALSTYILVGITREHPRSNEAALKYFLLGGFASAFLLYGISMTYGLTGTTEIPAVASYIARNGLTGSPMLVFSVMLFAVGFGFKVAAAPFHAWAPDAYEGAPTSVTAFMSVGTKAAGFAALGRVMLGAFSDAHFEWSIMLVPLAIVSIVLGNVTAIAQSNIKRMLAYSSIAHAGYALLGVIAGTQEGLSATMNYLFIYAFMTLGAFAVVILLKGEEIDGENIPDYKGLAKSHPLVSALMLVFMFSLTGIPPTAGFVGKFYVFLAAIRAGYTSLAVVAVVFSVVSAFFYLRIVMYMYMREPTRKITIAANVSIGLALAVAGVVILVLGVLPSPWIDYAQASSLAFR